MEFGDTEGATSCKECELGSVRKKNIYSRSLTCVKCRIGTVGKGDGVCHQCDGTVEFSDIEGATKCK